MKTLNVSCIQRFSTGDGPGIRTTVFLKGCNLHCPWCHNPENISDKPQTLVYRTGKTVTYGKITAVGDVLSDVLEDKEFYINGGGVTVSGGEPMLQADGVSELFKALKENGVSTLIDTAGCVEKKSFELVSDHTDIFYYDFKTADEEKYKTVIGGDKNLIFDNLCYLIKTGKTVHVRIPLIPGFNMSEKDSLDICAELLKAGVEYADLLPFHRLGLSKYEASGLDYKYKNVKPPEKEAVEKIKSIYEKHFTVIVE